MKVYELIERLKQMPQDRIVLCDTGVRSENCIEIFMPIECVAAGVNELDGAVILDGYVEED